MRNRFFYGGKGRGIPTAKSLTTGRTWQRMLALFALIVTLGIGQMWATDLEIPLTNLKLFPLDYGLVKITNTENTSISSNQLQVSKKTAKFKVSTTLTGFYLKSISFTDANPSKNGGFTCDEGSYMSGPTSNVYTYMAPNATTTEANFSLIGSGGTAKMGTIIVTLSTSEQVERLSAFGSISEQKIPFTSSAATSNVELSVPASNAVSTSSSRISIGSGGKHLIVSTKNDKLLKNIIIPKYQQSTYEITGSSDPAGTYNKTTNVWTPTAATNASVDLTLTVSSTVYSQEIFVVYADATKHHVTYALGGDYGTTPMQADVAEGAKFNLHNGTTGITPPTGKQFAGWNDGTTTYLGGAEYTMSTSDVTLTAVWENAKTDPTATFSAGAYVVGASALDLSGLWSSNSDGAVTYALKEASDDATVSSTSFTATKAGSYVVTASQAATATYNAIVKEATITVTWPATGAATVTYEVKVGTSQTTLDTNKKEANSSSISNFVGFTTAGGLEVQSGGGKTASSPKIATPTAKDDAKYVYVTFDVASGYIFTINSVTTKMVAVSNPCDIEVELSDATTSEALSYNQTNNNDPGADHEFEFAGKAYEGTVTLKIYAYGASASSYRIGKPLTISGTVAVKPSPSAPSISAPTADSEAEYDLNDEIAPLAITATGYPTPTYQWYYNSSATTEGATSLGASAQTASYTPANNVASDLYYYCVATNSQGSATSHYFHVTVNAPAVPTIYTETTAMTLTSAKVATASETFTFSGANLGETAVTLVLASAVDGLTLSESSVTPTAGAIAATEVTVSYKSLLDVAEANVDLYLKQGDDILKTIVLTYSSTAGIEDLTSISAATTWDWKDAADAAFGTLGQNDMIVLANADVTWDAGFNALAIAGKLQHYYRDSKYAQGNELKFNTTIPGRVTVTFSNTGSKDIARAPRITDVNGTYSPTDEADGSKNTTAMTYTHNVAAGDVLIAGFEMQTGTPANMLRYYKVEFVPTYTVAYAAGEHGSGTMTDANAYVAGDEVTLLANAFTPATGFVWSGWSVKDALDNDVPVTDGKFTMPASNVTVTAQWDDASKVVKIVETDVKYDSWAAAIAAVETNQTIQLIQDVAYTDTWNIAINVTLDLNGQNLTCTSTGDAVAINAGGKLTIMDGTVAAVDPTIDELNVVTYAAGKFTSSGWLINVYNGGEFVMNSGWLLAQEAAVYIEKVAVATINNGVLETHDNAVIMGHGSNGKGGYTINVHGGILLGHIESAGSASMAIYHPNIGTLNIDGGKLISTNGPGVVIRGGMSNITGGEIIAQGSGTGKCGDASLQLGAVGIAADFKSAYPGVANTNVAISGTVDVNGQAGAVEAIYAAVEPTVAEEAAIAVSGGSFNTPVDNTLCAENYVPKDNGDGTYGVKPKDGVCIVKITPTSQTKGTQTGLYPDGDELTISLNSGMNLGGSGKYIGVKSTEYFQEGDVLHLNMSTYQNSQNATAYVYADKDASVFLFDTEEKCDENKDYYITMPAAVNGHKELYIVRTDGNKWNGGPAVMEILRPMQPMLTAITIDGRAGVIDEEHKTVEVTIPNEAVLSALTVVPTIVWNEAAATNSIVVNDGSAWIEGANTYKLTDKDGDYTVYTITLTRDVLKHTVSFNTHGGSAVASELVVHGGYLAAAPADPTKEDYIFQYWSETEDGAEVDVTTVQINADKEFHAVWASDGAIKLLDGSTVNHTNFITGVTADETVEFQGNTVNYAKFSGTVSGVNGVKDLTRVIAYNATTNKTKIQISAHNNSTSARNILVKGLVEGASAAVDLATIALGNKEDKVSDWIEFDNAANRTIYIMVSSSAGDVYFTQVKVVESGDALKQSGEAGYAINLNKGRLFGPKETNLAFEGATFNLSSDYQPTNTGYAKIKSSSISFTVASPVLMTVTTSNNKTYYVTEGAAGTDNETAKTGASEFNLTAGTWYITGDAAAEVQITNIAFALPKCEKPVITTEPATKINFGPGNLTATVVAAEPTEGTLSYQWYNADGDAEVDGATEATLTTTTEGTYYVIVTNSLAGYQDNSTKSAEATLRYRVINDATLSALSYGDPATAIALEADKYEYRVILDEGTTDVPALHATATMDTYADVVITDAATFTDYNAQSTVHVTAEDGVTELTYTVNFIVKHIYTALEDVIESTTWNWTGSVDQKINDVPNKGVIIANYIEGDNFEMIEGKADEYARRNQNGGVYQGTYLHFNTTVPGKVKFYFRAPSSGENCTITVKNGGRTVVAGTRSNSFGWSNEVFVEGDVVIEMVNDKDGGGTTRVQQVVFTVAEPDYTRPVRQGYYGTICLPNGGVMANAALYDVAYFDAPSKKIYFDQIIGGVMEAGVPYIFLPNEGEDVLKVYYTDEADAPAGSHNGLVGSYVQVQIEDGVGNYILSNNRYREVVAGALAYVTENRAYIQMSAVPNYAPAPAPGRRRIAFDVQSAQSPTDLMEAELLNAEGVQKMVINGELFILRGGKMFDATGRLVK